jgi:hypothetical protein
VNGPDSPAGFDRLRRRSPDAMPVDPALGEGLRDPQGRRTLFSVAEQAPSWGVTLGCSRCHRTSVVTPRQVLPLAVPSVHLPLIKRGHPSWMRCPACGRRAWVRLGLNL